MLAERQQAMMEFIQQSNQQLAQTITHLTSPGRTTADCTATGGYVVRQLSKRVTELQGNCARAPSEVVVDVSQQMTQNSDELIQQILTSLKRLKPSNRMKMPPPARGRDHPAE